MVNNQITVKQLLDLDNFDPFNIDMTEFNELLDSLPRDANLDLAVAEKLASQYLRAADRASEYLSTLILFEQKAKINRNTIRAKLYLLAKGEGYETVADRNAYVESHEDFVNASELFAKIQAVKALFDLKHESFLNGHRFMKDKYKSEQKHLVSSLGFSETAGSSDNVCGEKEWK